MKTPVVILLLVALAAAACSGSADTPDEVVLLTHDSFAITPEVLESFETETGVAVRVVRGGDAGSVVNQAILTKDNPIADVLFGVDNAFLSRALDAEIFEAYAPETIAVVPADLRVEGDVVTPIDYGDVCVNYDKAAFTDIPPPATLADLAAPAYRGLLVVQDPATSSPGLAFLLATIDRFGDDGWQAYWEALLANDTDVAAGWEEAYYGAFSGGAGEGDRPLVVSYASSPPAEVFFGDLAETPTGVITDGCFRQVEYAGVLRGAAAPDAARRLVDFMLSERFQEDIPLNMFVYPANAEADLPDVFAEHSVIPQDPVMMDPQRIDENRERWIEEWTALSR